MSLLCDDILPPQEASADRTTRSKHNGSKGYSSQHSKPTLCHHTSDFGVPDEVQEPEVGGEDGDGVIVLQQVVCEGESGGGPEAGQDCGAIVRQEDS